MHFAAVLLLGGPVACVRRGIFFRYGKIGQGRIVIITDEGDALEADRDNLKERSQNRLIFYEFVSKI